MIHPNFFILGAQKAGTTYLAKALLNHDDVLFSEPKEPMFFSRANGLNTQSYLKYCNLYFSKHNGQKMIGEGSTTYLQRPRALANIKKYVPGTPKFIVCMRQPVDKGISFVVHNWRRGRHKNGFSFESTFEMPISYSALKSSRYADSIELWLESYPRSAFLFLKFEDLQTDPKEFMRQTTDFLEIDPAKRIPTKQINVGMPILFKQDYLEIQSTQRDIDDLRIPIESLMDLQNMCNEDVRRTADLTGLDLTNWTTLPDFESMYSKL